MKENMSKSALISKNREQNRTKNKHEFSMTCIRMQLFNDTSFGLGVTNVMHVQVSGECMGYIHNCSPQSKSENASNFFTKLDPVLS